MVKIYVSCLFEFHRLEYYTSFILGDGLISQSSLRNLDLGPAETCRDFSKPGEQVELNIGFDKIKRSLPLKRPK